MLKKRIVTVLTCLALVVLLLPMHAMAKQNPIPLVRNVRITGNAVVGQTLTGLYEYWGADTEGITATYQWYVSKVKREQQFSIDYSKISGATTDTLVLQSAHKGLTIVFEVVLTDSTGTHTFRSPALSVIAEAASADANPTVPVVSNAKPVLSYNYNTSEPDRMFAHYTYVDVNAGENDAEEGSEIQWMRADSFNGKYTDIDGATGQSYVLTADDKAKPHFFKFRVTPKNKAGEVGETVIGWAMGVGSLLPTVQDSALSNGKTATGAHYTTYNASGTYYHYWYKYCDGDYDSTYGYTNNNTTVDAPSITGVDMKSVKKVNTLVIYAGNFNGGRIDNPAIMHSTQDRKNYVNIPITLGDGTPNTSFITASAPVEIRVPEFTDRYLYLQTSRAQSSIGEIQAYYLETPENVIVETDCPDLIKLPIGGSLPEIKVSAVNRNDNTAVPDSNIFVVPPTLPEVSEQAVGQTYQYNITVRDNMGGLTLVQRTVELVAADAEPEMEVTAAFGDGTGEITAVKEGMNKVTVTAVNNMLKDAAVQPIVGLYNGGILEKAQVGEKTTLNGSQKAYTFDFTVEDAVGRTIRVLAWKDLDSMEPMQVINGYLPASQK